MGGNMVGLDNISNSYTYYQAMVPIETHQYDILNEIKDSFVSVGELRFLEIQSPGIKLKTNFILKSIEVEYRLDRHSYFIGSVHLVARYPINRFLTVYISSEMRDWKPKSDSATQLKWVECKDNGEIDRELIELLLKSV